jgi:hypothetical protein
MHYVTVAQLLLLLLLAKPVIAKRIFGETYATPLDGNTRFVDGRPLFGRSKTIRGVMASLLVTTLGARVIGLEFGDWAIGGYHRHGRRLAIQLRKSVGLISRPAAGRPGSTKFRNRSFRCWPAVPRFRCCDRYSGRLRALFLSASCCFLNSFSGCACATALIERQPIQRDTDDVT